MSTASERTALYRLLASSGRLLYVGISSNPDFRWGTHSTRQPWWPEVADRKVEWFASREAAAMAEIVAIKEERPLYNKQHSVTRIPWPRAEGAEPELPRPRFVKRKAGPELPRPRFRKITQEELLARQKAAPPQAVSTAPRRFRLKGEQTSEGLHNIAVIEAAFEMGLLTNADIVAVREQTASAPTRPAADATEEN